jgi:galacturan 1,4-alpha-galacturonidase
MAIINGSDILLEDIYVNNESNSGSVSSNTDGANTIYCDNITFRRWSVTNGDDSISVKANSTNIIVEDSEFYSGLGLSFGSIGQYDGVFEFIENVTARNIRCFNTQHASYVKTWTGQQ